MTRIPPALLVGASLAAVLTAALVLLGAPADASQVSTSAAAAVRAVTDGRAEPSTAVLPADFRQVMGYRPARVNGRLVDRHGDCSSVVPLPADFAAACAEHDLGYDLLRYAALTGRPLDGWARDAVDARLAEHLRELCAQRPAGPRRTGCRSTADVAVTAVRLNTLRQLHGVPEETAGSLAVTGGVAVTGLSAVGHVALRGRRRRRGSRPAGVLLPAGARA